jgi:REP element-mobilizing transposase RayT
VRGKTYFVTFSTRRQWTLPESIRSRVLECCVSHHSITFYLHAAVVMPDHVHLLLTPLQDDDGAAYGLPEILQGIKGASAHAVNHALSGTGAVWEQESFDRLLQSDERVAQKAEYICENPVRAGLVAQADEWPWIWRAWVEGRAPDTISR